MKRLLCFAMVSYMMLSGGACAASTSNSQPRLIEFKNDLLDLVEGLPEETEELRESIEYTVEVNGVCIEPNQKQRVVIMGDCCTIMVKSKLPFHEHLDSKSRFKKVAAKSTSWVNTHYSFTCTIPEKNFFVHLAPLILHGCQLLKEKAPYAISYKKPFGIKICLQEILHDGE